MAHSNVPEDRDNLKCDNIKTVSFSPKIHSPTGIGNVEQDILKLESGSELFKIRTRHKYLRRYAYDAKQSCIFWNSSNKRPTNAKIYINSIREVRMGKNTESFRKSKVASDFNDVHCFSIIYGSSFQTLNLACLDLKQVNCWVSVLNCLISGHFKKNIPIRERWLREQFNNADRDASGTLEKKECIELFHYLNLNISKKELLKQFEHFDNNKNGLLDFDEFKLFFESISTRDEIVTIFNEYCRCSENEWDIKDFLIFLKSSQKYYDADESTCEQLIEKYEPTICKNDKNLSLDGLMNFLLDPTNFILDCTNSDFVSDLTQPLSHYFISSSHNTYLLDDQMKGPSSIEGYIRSLRAGCRCVEIDVWNGPNGNPIVFHGHTLTSKILFRDVLCAIKDHAFVTSKYPVVISIENHCNLEQQATMANNFKDVFGEFLFDGNINDKLNFLPSPESLKNKILLKGKKLKSELEFGDVSDEDEAADISDVKSAVSSNVNQEISAIACDVSNSITEIHGSQDISKEIKGASKKTKSIKLAVELSKLINYIQAQHFNGFDQSLLHETMYYHMSSLSETKVEEVISNEGWKLIEYNKRQLSRIYPKGTRINSSNYNPVFMWNHGCQIVALNFQTDGVFMDINRGFFQQNYNCGYVLKPLCLRQRLLTFQPSNQKNKVIPGIIGRRYSITIISGQQLPKPSESTRRGEVIDPYVMLTVYSCEPLIEFKTVYIEDNGFNPIWTETFIFEVKFPEVSILRILVQDYDIGEDDFIGQYSLPLSKLRNGYRHVPLLDKSGNIIEFATLFLRIEIEDVFLSHIKSSNKSLSSLQPLEISDFLHLPNEVSDCLISISKPIKDGFMLFEDFYSRIFRFKALLNFSPDSSFVHCFNALLSKDENNKFDIEETNGKLMITSDLHSSSNKYIIELTELLNICYDVLDRSPVISKSLSTFSSNILSELEMNGSAVYKINKTEKMEDLLFNLSSLVGTSLSLVERLNEVNKESKLVLDLVIHLSKRYKNLNDAS